MAQEATTRQRSGRAGLWLPLAGLAAALLIAAGILAWRAGWLEVFRDAEHVRTLVLSWGVWGPALIIGLNAIQVILSPIPGQALNIATGYLYGPWLGTLYTVAGMLLGSFILLLIVRGLGRSLAERLVPVRQLGRFDQLVRQRGALFLFFVFLIPFLPDDVACIAAGLTPLPIYHIMLLQLAGRTPGLLAANLLGANLVALTPFQWVLVGAVLLLAGLFFLRFRADIERWLMSLIHRLTRSRDPQERLPRGIGSDPAEPEKDWRPPEP